GLKFSLQQQFHKLARQSGFKTKQAHLAELDLFPSPPCRFQNSRRMLSGTLRLKFGRNAKREPSMAAAELQISDSDVALEIVNMDKWYGDFHVLRDINLKVMRGERIVVAGPSGSGKSTMIRCINRLEEHQKGQIIVDGIELTNDLKKIDEVRREVGMVFQHFN